MITTLKPKKEVTVIKDMPNADYHGGEWQREYISSTSLKSFLTSPKFFEYSKTHPKQISLSATMQGSISHALMQGLCNNGTIDGALDEEFFIFAPPVNPKTGEPFGSTTKAYIEEYEAQKMLNNGKMPISSNDVENAKIMLDNLLNNCGNTSKIVENLIKAGKAEISFFIEIGNNLKFKFRPDVITSEFIADWKFISADNLHESTIIKTIDKFGYGLSAAFYQFFSYLATGKLREFLWIFQQKDAPFDAVCVSAAPFAYMEDIDGAIVKGPSAIAFESILQQLIKCEKDSFYPGAEILIEKTQGYRIMYPQIPIYINKSTPSYFNEEDNNNNF